ncbi:hypothetical protein [Klenkia brasiliensis]|nr:hypothetical protein [Klenkia brasiliensis]
MTEVVDVHVVARPAGPLRGAVAAVSGWVQAGTPAQLHRGCPPRG